MCTYPNPAHLVLCARCPDAARRRCENGLLRLYDYWNTLRAGREFPSRGDIDPLHLGKMLPNIFLVEVLEQAPFFRYRLTGTHVDEIHEQNLTGKSPRDIRTPEIAVAVEQQYRHVVEHRKPRCDHVRLLAQDRSFWHYERLILPLSDDGIRINMLLCCMYSA